MYLYIKGTMHTIHTKPFQSNLSKDVTFTAHTKPIQSKLDKNVTFTAHTTF